MTLYFGLVFMMLVGEMAMFVALIIPMPFTAKRKLFNFISGNPLIAKLQYGMKIAFIGVLILFIDSVNRVYRVQIELAAASSATANGGYFCSMSSYLYGTPLIVFSRAAVMGSERMEVQARKFYSQRNMYLCGFTLFLSLILNRTYVMILDVLRLEEEVKRLQGDPKASGKDAEKLAMAGNAGEISGLKNKLAEKERDLDTLKKQSEGLSREYNDLSSKYNKMEGTDGTPKKDK